MPACRRAEEAVIDDPRLLVVPLRLRYLFLPGLTKIVMETGSLDRAFLRLWTAFPEYIAATPGSAAVNDAVRPHEAVLEDAADDDVVEAVGQQKQR